MPRFRTESVGPKFDLTDCQRSISFAHPADPANVGSVYYDTPYGIIIESVRNNHTQQFTASPEEARNYISSMRINGWVEQPK